MKIPDLTELKGKEFVFTEDFLETNSTITFSKGVRFKITSVKKGYVNFRIVSSLEECMSSIERFAAFMVKAYGEDAEQCEHALKLWLEDPDGFVELKEGEESYRGSNHPLNLTYNKNGIVEVYSKTHRRKDGKLNKHSYFEGHNVWYNKEYYEKELESVLYQKEKYTALLKGTIQDVYSTHYKGWKHYLAIKDMNKAEFEPVAKKQKIE